MANKRPKNIFPFIKNEETVLKCWKAVKIGELAHREEEKWMGASEDLSREPAIAKYTFSPELLKI